jgi:hypothetical protein
LVYPGPETGAYEARELAGDTTGEHVEQRLVDVPPYGCLFDLAPDAGILNGISDAGFGEDA